MLWKWMLVVLIVGTVTEGTLVSAFNVAGVHVVHNSGVISYCSNRACVTIRCNGSINYDLMNPEEDANDVGNNSSDTFEYALENIDGEAMKEPNIVEEKTGHWRFRP